MKKNCPYCGSINEDALTCVNCGRDVSAQFDPEAIRAKKAEAERIAQEEKEACAKAEEERQKAKTEQRKQKIEEMQTQDQEESIAPEVYHLWDNATVQGFVKWICWLCPVIGMLLGTLILQAPLHSSKTFGAKCIRLAAIAFYVELIIAIIAAVVGVFLLMMD